jgi:hypothetical protein
MKGKPENGTMLEPALLNQTYAPGGREDATQDQTATCPRVVLSGILLRGWESQPHGEGPDGSMILTKETYAGHAGSDTVSQPHCEGYTTGFCNGQL